MFSENNTFCFKTVFLLVSITFDGGINYLYPLGNQVDSQTKTLSRIRQGLVDVIYMCYYEL